MVLRDGMMQLYGPRDQVLAALMQQAQQAQQAAAQQQAAAPTQVVAAARPAVGDASA